MRKLSFVGQAVRTSALALLVLALLLSPLNRSAAGAAPPSECGRDTAVTLSLAGDKGLMLVTAKINGAAVTMAVDTGAQWTAITPETVKRLQLPPDAWHGGLHRGVGSFSDNINAVTRSFEIGGMTIEGRSLSVVPLSFAATAAVSPPFAGLLGADFLYRFDLDIDLPHHGLTLYRGGLCRPGKSPAWTQTAAVIPLVKSTTNRLTLPVTLDGHPFRAIVDTGATASLITRPNALRDGVTPEMLDRDPIASTGGVGPQPSDIRLHIFDNMQVGPERLQRVNLAVGGRLLGGGDMLLGLDYLRSRHVFLSYTDREMFVGASP